MRVSACLRPRAARGKAAAEPEPEPEPDETQEPDAEPVVPRGPPRHVWGLACGWSPATP